MRLLKNSLILCLFFFASFNALASQSFTDGVDALKAGELDKALSLLEQASTAQPKAAEVWWELGWVYWRLDRYDEGVEAWNTVKALNPQYPELDEWLPQMISRRDLARLPVNVEVSSKTESSKVTGELRLMAVGDLMMGSDIRHGEAGFLPTMVRSSLLVLPIS